MGIERRERLKEWFSRGEYPTEAQFWSLIDSFLHRDEDTLPLLRVAGLGKALNNKYDRTAGEQLARLIESATERTEELTETVEGLRTNMAFRSVDIGELDTMGTDGTPMEMLKFLIESGNQTVYAVRQGMTSGVMLMFSDFGMHVIYQWLLTSNSVEDGKLLSEHVDGVIGLWHRHYNVRSGTSPAAEGSWTAWEPFVGTGGTGGTVAPPYRHPATHPADMIEETADRVFVSQTAREQMTLWLPFDGHIPDDRLASACVEADADNSGVLWLPAEQNDLAEYETGAWIIDGVLTNDGVYNEDNRAMNRVGFFYHRQYRSLWAYDGMLWPVATGDAVNNALTAVSNMDKGLTELNKTIQQFGDYVNSTMATKEEAAVAGLIPIVEQDTNYAVISPGVLNRWGTMTDITVDFEQDLREGYAHEFMMEFTSGASPTVLSLPGDVVFPEDVEIEANMRYQISVVNNFGLIAGVPFEAGGAPEPPATKTGIGLLMTDGTQRDSSEIGAGETIDGASVEAITFEADGHSWLIAPEAMECYFCAGNVVCPSVEAVWAANLALPLFDGKENTEAYRTGMSYTDENWAVNKACNTTLGGRRCWLPSLGEISAIFKHRDEIDALMKRCGFAGLAGANYWSSTLATRKDAASGEAGSGVSAEAYLYCVYGVYNSGDYDGFNVQGYYWALPITDYVKE